MILSGYLKSYIVLPSTIYGRPTNKLVQAGICNTRSDQIPRLIDIAIKRGEAGMTGPGLSMWPNVDIDERTFPFSPPIRRSVSLTSLHDQWVVCTILSSTVSSAAVLRLVTVLMDTTLVRTMSTHGWSSHKQLVLLSTSSERLRLLSLGPLTNPSCQCTSHSR